MKKIKVSILFSLIAFFATSQCDNEVSTNPSNPSNNSLPDLESSGIPYSYDERYYNGFDWINGNTGQNSGYRLDNMIYNQNQPYGNMSNIQSPNVAPFYTYLNKALGAEEMNPQNGWELLLVNLGTYPDNQTDHPFTDLQFTPYIVLYNKYQGVVRVFVTYGRNQKPEGSIDGVTISLSFALSLQEGDLYFNNASGLLRYGKGNDVALDQTTKTTVLSAVGKNPGGENKWYSADFQVAYDPCTCIYPSRLKLNFNWFSATAFKLYGRELSQTTEDLHTINQLIDQNFLGNFEFDKFADKPSEGFIMYNSMSNAVDDYLKQMEKYEQKLALTNEENAKIKRNKAIAKAFKFIILSGVNTPAAGVTGVSIIAALAGQQEWATEILTHAKDIVDKDTVKFYKLSKEMKTLLGGQFDFFINKAFKEKPAPTKPSKPAVSYSEMYFEGTLSDNFDIPGPDFMAPGTFNKNTFYGSPIDDPKNYPFVYKYPIYNEVLGSFALLKSPKIILSENILNDSTYHDADPIASQNNVVIGYDNIRYQSWTRNYQMKLDSDLDLEYALNTALDISDYTISSAFKVIAKIVDHPSSQRVTCFLDPYFTTNLSSIDVDVNEYYPIKSDNFGYNNGKNYCPSWASNCSFEPKTNPQNFIDKNSFELISDFFPINSFKPIVYSLGLKNQDFRHNASFTNVPLPYINPTNYGIFLNFDIELKLMVDIEFNSFDENGDKNKLTQIFTYKIRPEDITMQNGEIISNLENSPLNIMQFQEDLFLNDISFNGNQVDGCTLDGTHYTCQAWNDVTINGNLTTASGYSVDIFAGNKIEELPESVVSPEIVLDIKQILDFSSPMPQATTANIVNFCDVLNQQTDSYQAQAHNARGNYGQNITQDSILEQESILEHKPFDFTIYPNPANAQTRIALKNSTFNEVFASVYDVMGKLIHVDISQINENTLSLNVAGLEKGIYFVKVKSNFEEKTKQLVVN
jgi:hypothetical protein